MKTSSKRQVVGVLGLGEVGKAIAKACRSSFQVLTKDMDHDTLGETLVEVLHINIPFINNRQFITPVLAQIKRNHPKLVIINSTVAPGTTRLVGTKANIAVAHAPMMGVHPHLYEYLFKFPKFIGPSGPQAAKLAKQHFVSLGLKPKVFRSSQETEVAKVFDTTYYGLAIVFCKWLKEYCDQSGLNFDEVYTQYNQAYNQGYRKDLPQVIRPLLTPMPGKLGGHCVVPNAKILKRLVKDPFSELIVELNKTF